jgi:hypothetical protein
MRFRRKREVWGVIYTGTSGERTTVRFGSRAKAGRLAARLQSVYEDVRPVKLPYG